MFDLGRFNPLNLLIYGGTKLVYNQVTKDSKPKKNTIKHNYSSYLKNKNKK